MKMDLLTVHAQTEMCVFLCVCVCVREIRPAEHTAADACVQRCAQ